MSEKKRSSYHIKEIDSKYVIQEVHEIQEDGSIDVVGIKQYKKKSLNILVKFEESSSTGHFIPQTFNEAVKELNEMLNKRSKKLITSKDWNNERFNEREELFYELALFLEKIWALKTNNNLSLELQKSGIYYIGGHDNDSIHWVLEALMKGVYNYNNGIKDNSGILPFYGYLSMMATRVIPSNNFPFESVPSECGVNINRNEIKNIWIENNGTNIYLDSRLLLYVKCRNNRLMAYLLEKGWFYPEDRILHQIESIERSQ